MSKQNGTAVNGKAPNGAKVVSLATEKPNTETPAENPKTETTQQQTPELSNVVVLAPAPEEKPEKQIPLDEIFFKMDKLYSLRDKREKLKESLEKLLKFKLSSDQRSDNIILQDKNGSTFSTYNPVVITKTLDWLKDDITQRIAEVEREIRTL